MTHILRSLLTRLFMLLCILTGQALALIALLFSISAFCHMLWLAAAHNLEVESALFHIAGIYVFYFAAANLHARTSQAARRRGVIA